MYNNEAILPVVVIFTVLIAPVSGNSSARPTPYPPRTDHALPHNVTSPQCLSNQSLMTCSVHHKCCQSQSNILVEQLQQIKDKFQAVDSVIRKDYENMRGVVAAQLTVARVNITKQLGDRYETLIPAFNTTLNRLYHLFIGYDKSDDMQVYIHQLASRILFQTLSKSSGHKKDFSRTIKGINIFWELNTDQRTCVVEYMIDSTEIGRIVDRIVDNMRNTTQSLHEYMSLLGTMVEIIQKMVQAQQSQNCIAGIVKMQQCSLCTATPVCPAFYDQLLSGCVPQLEELYKRWDTLMNAMSELTLRLCEHELDTLYRSIYEMSDFISSEQLETLIYQHGVLAYMKCVQPDSHKRSVLSKPFSNSEESMVPEERYSNVPDPLLSEEYVYQGGHSIIDDIKLSKRSVSDPVPPSPPSLRPTETPKNVDHLPQCRKKLGLNFPPLDLGTTSSFLNISISSFNSDCWNGTEIGSYVVDINSQTHSKKRPEALALRELDEKMCKYAKECGGEFDSEPYNNSHHRASAFQVLASLVASLYYCCC